MNQSQHGTGICGMVKHLASSLQAQNDELAREKAIVAGIKHANSGSGDGLAVQLGDIRRYFSADITRMEEEFMVQAALQKSENIRLQQQLTTLKGEKTSIHQQIIALQRRVEELEGEVGTE